MDDLTMLKQDLEIPNTLRDEYLQTLLDAVDLVLESHGVVIPTGEEIPADYQHLKVMYAAYYYRKRAETVNTGRGTSDASSMPRMLQFALHNYLLHQKMAVEE